jgi:hypothetical protein
MKKFFLMVLLVLLVLVTVLMVFFRKQTVDYLTTPVYYELSERENNQLTEARRRAYNFAVSCSGVTNPKVKFEEIYWALTPGHVIEFNVIEGGSAKLKGWADINDNVIFMPFTERNTRWIMAHEVLHLLGFIGHPDHPFRTCNLLPEQQ